MTTKELGKELKRIRGMAKCLNVLAKEIEKKGKFDEEDIDLLKKIASSVLWQGVTLDFFKEEVKGGYKV